MKLFIVEDEPPALDALFADIATASARLAQRV